MKLIQAVCCVLIYLVNLLQLFLLNLTIPDILDAIKQIINILREMTVKNIMISNINPEYTAMYIANVLKIREIAHVNSITLIPEIKNDEIFNIAYIDIENGFNYILFKSLILNRVFFQ